MMKTSDEACAVEVEQRCHSIEDRLKATNLQAIVSMTQRQPKHYIVAKLALLNVDIDSLTDHNRFEREACLQASLLLQYFF